MTASSVKSNSINNSARCNHRFPNGMRCRLLGFADQPFCPKHSEHTLTPRPDPMETAATLTAGLDDFTDPAQINTFLSRLLLLLAQDKISARRAAVLTYISSQLLHTHRAIEKEPPQIIFDIPRPQRPAYVEPPPVTPGPASQPTSTCVVQPTPVAPSKPAGSPQPSSWTPAPNSQLGSPAALTETTPRPVSPTGAPTAALPITQRTGSPRPHVRQPTWADLDR
jgi:hypothetical protein